MPCNTNVTNTTQNALNRMRSCSGKADDRRCPRAAPVDQIALRAASKPVAVVAAPEALEVDEAGRREPSSGLAQRQRTAAPERRAQAHDAARERALVGAQYRKEQPSENTAMAMAHLGVRTRRHDERYHVRQTPQPGT
jgi:hypothetical protein